MSDVFINLGGKVLDHREELGAITQQIFNVPRGRKWVVLGGYYERDVNATFDIAFRNAGNQIIWEATQVAAGVVNEYWPINMADATERAFIESQPVLGGGWDIRYLWGAAQTSPIVNLWVLEI